MSKSVLLRDLKSLAQRCKEQVATAAEASAKGIEELNTAKADKVREVSCTIPATGWTAAVYGKYTVYKDIAVSGLTAGDVVILSPAEESRNAAKQAGLGCEPMAGKLRVRARKTPTAVIAASCHIIQGEL